MNLYFSFHVGPPLSLEEDSWTLFETQFYTPEVELIPQQDFDKLQSNVKKVIQKLNRTLGKSKSKKVSSVAEKEVIVLDDDANDFVTQLGRKLTAKPVLKDAKTSSPSSTDDFVTQKVKATPAQNLVLSNKRPSKVTRRFMKDLPKFVPYKFPHLEKARQFKELILSKEYQSKHKE